MGICGEPQIETLKKVGGLDLLYDAVAFMKFSDLETLRRFMGDAGIRGY